MNRIGLKTLCLVASIIIWGLVASTSDVEQDARLPLVIKGLQPGFTFEGDPPPPARITVRLKGSKLGLMAHKYFNHFVGEVQINLADQVPGPPISYEIGPRHVFTDLTVVNISPGARVRLQIDQIISRKLPVRLETDGSVPVGRGFLVPPRVMPDSVVVTGASRFFLPGAVVPTQRVNLDRMKESQDFPLGLVSPHDFLHLERSEVSASFKMAAIQDRTLANIKVIPLVDQGQLEVGVSPPVVDVMVRGVADSVRALDRSRILVTVPVGSLAEGVHVLSGQVEYPPWLTLIGLKPSEFQVIVGNPPSMPDTSSADPGLGPEPAPDDGGGRFE
jgi:YbbR domain-containing protein